VTKLLRFYSSDKSDDSTRNSFVFNKIQTICKAEKSLAIDVDFSFLQKSERIDLQSNVRIFGMKKFG